MLITMVEIGNYRKLLAARISFAPDKTVLVGANNSGKTSAMTALRRFLVDTRGFTINDLARALASPECEGGGLGDSDSCGHRVARARHPRVPASTGCVAPGQERRDALRAKAASYAGLAGRSSRGPVSL